jgi:hypothetical protein
MPGSLTSLFRYVDFREPWVLDGFPIVFRFANFCLANCCGSGIVNSHKRPIAQDALIKDQFSSQLHTAEAVYP